MTTKCEHNACQSVDITPAGVALREIVSPTGQVWLEVRAVDGDRFMGSVTDDGYRVRATGEWTHRWSVIAGGQCVSLDENTWVEGTWYKTAENLAATVKAFTAWCQRVSFSWRLALHG